MYVLAWCVIFVGNLLSRGAKSINCFARRIFLIHFHQFSKRLHYNSRWARVLVFSFFDTPPAEVSRQWCQIASHILIGMAPIQRVAIQRASLRCVIYMDGFGARCQHYWTYSCFIIHCASSPAKKLILRKIVCPRPQPSEDSFLWWNLCLCAQAIDGWLVKPIGLTKFPNHR